MSKRVRFQEGTTEFVNPAKISKHSLDSDEEEEEETGGRMHDDELAGQEETTIEYDNDIKITPFNMDDELDEDGHFDATGNFIFKKKIETTDNWLEDVNWLEVKKSQDLGKYKVAQNLPDEDLSLTVKEKLVMYKEILNMLNDKENILRAIKRMSICEDSRLSASASQRWLKSKKEKNVSSKTTERGNPEGLLRITELADRLLQSGDFDIYQKLKSELQEIVAVSEEKSEEDELEMFGQFIDKGEDKKANGNNAEVVEGNLLYDNQADMWQLKKSHADDAVIEGPYQTAQMIAWVNEGKFNEEELVLVRQTSKTDGPFYNIRRIDFELYE